MTSMDCISSNNQVSTNKLGQRFNCDFCSRTFQTEFNFNEHVLEHFEKKNCSNCDKFIIRIGTNWYELHIDDIDAKEFDSHDNDLAVECIAEVKVEEIEEEEEALAYDDSNYAEITSKDDADFVFDDGSSTESSESTESDEYQITTDKNTKRKGAIKEPTSKKIEKTKPTEEQPKKEENEPRKRGRQPRIRCRICDRFILKSNFDVHLQKIHVPRVIVSKEKIKCSTCGKSFASAGNLKTHQTIHSGIKRFVCSYCGTSFRQLYHLTEHMNGHTGSKPYHCEVCDKRFGRFQIFRAHQRVHTGEKPHRCTIDGCDRAYAYDIDLKRHKFSAHGIYTKKHICSFCSKVFPENKLLKKHLESHSAGNIRKILTKTHD